MSVAEDTTKYMHADFCDCESKEEGDGVHVAGEPSDTICLNTPLPADGEDD